LDPGFFQRFALALLSTVGKKSHLAAALDFASNNALVSCTGTGLFAGENLVLAAGEAAQNISVAQGDCFDLLGAEDADGVTLSLDWHSYYLERNVFDTNFFILTGGSSSWLGGW